MSLLLLPNLEAAIIEAAERHERRAADAVGFAPISTLQAQRGTPTVTDAPEHGTDQPPSTPPAPASNRLPAPSPRRRWRLAGGTAGLAIAGLGAALLFSVAGRGELDVIAEAQAALAPEGQIIYSDMLIEVDARRGGKSIRMTGKQPPIERVEQWTAQDPERTHLKSHATPETAQRFGTPLMETAWDGQGARTNYWGGDQTMDTVTGMRPGSADLSVPGVASAVMSLGDLESMLAAGRLKDRGFTTVDGQRLRRLTGVNTDHFGLKSRVTYDLNPETFVPARLEFRTPMYFGNQGRPDGVEIRVATVRSFKRIPFNGETAKLLTVQPPAGTKITVRTMKEVRAWQRASRAKRAAKLKARKAARLARERAGSK